LAGNRSWPSSLHPVALYQHLLTLHWKVLVQGDIDLLSQKTCDMLWGITVCLKPILPRLAPGCVVADSLEQHEQPNFPVLLYAGPEYESWSPAPVTSIKVRWKHINTGSPGTIFPILNQLSSPLADSVPTHFLFSNFRHAFSLFESSQPYKHSPILPSVNEV
jgi:hypothetical protein